ncbi:hypothetical protein Poli38472_006397 [Pythium oligandrum]|uniref:SAP domain-containing protein n=1 Tax=Pythium oligandrum TaxID=41045 RepID=A0A8K1FE92_PYTOL|nr:hypothetical protein Poli38472_006397 [Pythium oligandrum]|eukprot:TMW56387.1 hypothetical protein Poli38472_006397 [Pythium oligandrum]
MQSVLSPLDRLREQRAQRLLEALQSDLRAQIRLEDEDAGRRGRHKLPRSDQQRLQQKITRLADPSERERLWNRWSVPGYQGTPINDLPKTREFWTTVDVTGWTKTQLDVACALLDLPSGGKKGEMIARIQDWVHAPLIRARKEEQERLEREREEILASGRVFAFGVNFHGQLGLGDRRSRSVPTEIEALRGEHIMQVFSGFGVDFAFAVASDGRVFTWGGGGKTLMDIASSNPLPSPTQNGASPGNIKIGMPQKPPRPAQVNVLDTAASSCFLFPRLVPQVGDKQLACIASARTDGHIAFTTRSGECFTWGKGDYGELGVDTKSKPKTMAPTPVGSVLTTTTSTGVVKSVKQVSVGNCHTAALTESGEFFVWGACWNGQLGLGVTKRSGVKSRREQLYFPTPTFVEAFARQRLIKVSCGAVHTAVVTNDGGLYTFGCGDGGRLGLGHSSGDVLQPERVTALERDFVTDVVCAAWHTLCLARPKDEKGNEDGGYVYAFGNGLHGQLGLGKQRMAALPTRIPDLYHRRVQCQRLAVSSYHSAALSTDGKLFTWGQNAGGCLGRSTVDNALDSAYPEAVADFGGYGVGPIVSIACGDHFTLVATGPWEPLEPRPQFTTNEQLNRHAKFINMSPKHKPTAPNQ